MSRFTTLLLLFALPLNAFADQRMCHYSVYKWNTIQRKAVDFQQVSKPYRELTKEEVDPYTGCSLCQEDQITLSINGIPDFSVCRNIAPQLEQALTIALESGQQITKVIGYRVGKTRGAVDADGNRTGFSNHSFGTAVDFNPGFNGLYDQCIEFNPSCRLIKGGAGILIILYPSALIASWSVKCRISVSNGAEESRAGKRISCIFRLRVTSPEIS